MSVEFDRLKNNLTVLDGMDRLEYLYELSKKNEGIPDGLKNDESRIWGCISTSFLIVDDIEPVVRIRIDSDAAFVKGLLFLLKVYVNDKTKNEVINIDEENLMKEIGLKNAISSQRMNGFYAAIKKLKESI